MPTHLLGPATLWELGKHARACPRQDILLPPFAADDTWEDVLWGQLAASTGLTEADDCSRKGLQTAFAQLLLSAPNHTPFVLHDMHSAKSVCGDHLKPDAVMSLRSKPMAPFTTGLLLDLRRQHDQYDIDKFTGKAIMYGRDFLRQLLMSLRTTVLVCLTALKTITLIRVSLQPEPDIELGERLSYSIGCLLSDVKRVLLQLLSSHPSDLHMQLPDLGPRVEVTGFLGYGATSHMYKACKDGKGVGYM